MQELDGTSSLMHINTSNVDLDSDETDFNLFRSHSSSSTAARRTPNLVQQVPTMYTIWDYKIWKQFWFVQRKDKIYYVG